MSVCKLQIKKLHQYAMHAILACQFCTTWQLPGLFRACKHCENLQPLAPLLPLNTICDQMQVFWCILLSMPSPVLRELQNMGPLDTSQVIKAMRQDPALENPVPKPSSVKPPPGLAGKAKPSFQVASSAPDLDTSCQVLMLLPPTTHSSGLLSQPSWISYQSCAAGSLLHADEKLFTSRFLQGKTSQ